MENLLNCKLCYKQYEDPIILPCLNSVCSKHVFSDKNVEIFKCKLCQAEHNVESDTFNTDKTMVELLKISGKYIDIDTTCYGTYYDKSEDLNKQLKDLVEKIELLERDPLFYIDDYFSKLRNKIDLSKEEKTKIIEEQHEILINQVNESEKECKIKLNFQKESLKKEQSLIARKMKLFQENQLFKIISHEKNYWNNKIEQQEQEIEKAKYLIKILQNELILKKDYSFVENLDLNEFKFGTLLITDKEIIDENRSKGTVSFVIDNFSKFKYSQEYRKSKQWAVIGNVPWQLLAIIKENENFELFLGFYLKPVTCGNMWKFASETLNLNPIYVSAILKIIEHNTRINHKEIKLKYKFEKNSNGYGFPHFISLKDILNESNGVYSKTEDSITLECGINILNELEFNNLVI